MNPSNVTLRQLRAFVSVAEAGGFTAASRQLHLTPSALSLLIKEMEGAIGVRLFDRTTRSTALSSAGAEFLPLARNVLSDLAQAVANTRDLEQKRRGTVRIACTPLYAATLLPELVRRYRERFPEIAVHVMDSLHEEALSRVLAGQADLGIAPQRKAPSGLTQELLFADRMWLVCRPDHPMAARRRVVWSQVLAEPFVSLTQDFTVQLQSDLFRHGPGLVLQPAYNVSFITTALGMVQSGVGITVQPGSALRLLEPFGLVARAVSRPTVFRNLSLFFKPDRPLSPAAAAFRAFVGEALSANALRHQPSLPGAPLNGPVSSPVIQPP